MNDVGLLSARDEFIAGVALYLGEGTKGDKLFEFTNADQRVIQFVAHWLRRFFEIDESRLQGAIWIHEGLDQEEARQFWSKVSGIPASQFQKTYVAKNKPQSRKIRKNIHPYGVFSIRYSDCMVVRRIMGQIAGLLQGAWYNNIDTFSPVAQSVEQDAVSWQPSGAIRYGKTG